MPSCVLPCRVLIPWNATASRKPITVKMPPTMAHTDVKKWYSGTDSSSTMIAIGDTSNEKRTLF